MPDGSNAFFRICIRVGLLVRLVVEPKHELLNPRSMSSRASFFASVLLSLIPIVCVSVQAGQTALQNSAWEGATVQTRKLLASGADPNEKTENNRPPLYLAISQGHFEDAKALLDAGADPKVEVDDGFPNGKRCLIQTAVRRGNVGIIKALLEAGAKVDHVDGSGQQPIHTAAEWGTPEMVKLLLAAGAKLDTPIKGAGMDSRNGYLPIHLAAFHGHTEMVKALIALGADVNAKDARGNTLVKEVVYGGCESGRLATLKVLLDAHADPNAADPDGRTPLDHASFYQEADAIRLLLAAGAKPTVNTLVTAASQGEVAPLKALLGSKEKFDVADPIGGQLLRAAAGSSWQDNTEMVQFLLAAGVDPNAADSNGRRALHGAVQSCNPDSVRLLIAANADVGAADKEGRTALHEVAEGDSRRAGRFISWQGEEGSLEAHDKAEGLWRRTNFMKIAKALKEAGAPLKARDKQGRTPSDVARVNAQKGPTGYRFGETRKDILGFYEPLAAYLDGGAFPAPEDPTPLFLEQIRYRNRSDAKRLLGIGARVDVVNADGQQPIHIAVIKADLDTVDLLLAASAKLDARDPDGLQAIHYAARELGTRGEIIRRLLEYGAKATAADNHGRQPLHWLLSKSVEERAKAARASEAGIAHFELQAAKALVEAGASPEAPDETGTTPLSMAQKSQRKELVAYFQEVLKKR